MDTQSQKRWKRTTCTTLVPIFIHGTNLKLTKLSLTSVHKLNSDDFSTFIPIAKRVKEDKV